MSAPSPLPRDARAGFVLHSYPFRETSLIVEAFTRDHGRVALVARGARRPRSSLRGVLSPFQPLLLSWSGRSELRTLVRAESQNGHLALAGETLMCGFYLNELLLKLLPRDDPHERLYDAYQHTLAGLAATTSASSIMKARRRQPSRGCFIKKFAMASFSQSSSQWSRGTHALCSFTFP